MPVPSYITRDVLKNALGIKVNDAGKNALLDMALNASAQAIYRKTGKRRFDRDQVLVTRRVPTPGRLVWDRRWRSFRLMTPDIATTEGLEVYQFEGGALASVTAIEPDNPGEPVTGLLGTFGDVAVIRAFWGWPEIPADIVQAQMLQAMRYYRRKDSPEGIAGTAEWGLVRVPRLDPDVAEMVEDYCIPAVG